MDVTFYTFSEIDRVFKNDVKNNGDFHFSFKKLIKKNPRLRLFATNSRGKPLIYLFDSQIIREFHQKQDCYEKPPVIREALKYLMPQALLILEGDTWKKHKKIMSQPLHYEFIQQQAPKIQKIARNFWKELEGKSSEKFRVEAIIQNITGELVGQIFFGEAFSGYTFEGEPVAQAFNRLFIETVKAQFKAILLNMMYIPKKWVPSYNQNNEKVKRFKDLCKEIVDKHKSLRKAAKDQAISATPCLLDHLLDSYDRGDEDSFNESEIIDEFVQVFHAGADPTAALSHIIIYYLANNLEAREKAVEEVDRLYSKDRDMDGKEFEEMSYLGAIVREALRLSSPVPAMLGRVAKCDHTLGEFKIKAGTLVQGCFVANNYNPLNYDDPEKFKPERWLDSDNKLKKVDGQAFIPFSAGQRACPGQNFTYLAVKVIISDFLKKFNFKVSDGYVHRMNFTAFYRPDNHIFFDVTPRA